MINKYLLLQVDLLILIVRKSIDPSTLGLRPSLRMTPLTIVY